MEANNNMDSDEVSVFANPQNYIYGDFEQNRFKAYQEELSKEKDLGEVWAWYSKDYFPFDVESYLEIVGGHMPDGIEDIVRLFEQLNAPVLMHEIFAACQRVYGKSFMVTFLKRAPICVEASKKKWNGSALAAPVVLDYMFFNLNNYNTSKEEVDLKSVEKDSGEIATVLSGRDDGPFLAWNYVKYILSRNVKNPEIARCFIKCIGDVFSPILEECYKNKVWQNAIRPSKVKLDEIRERFVKTGLLGNANVDSMYLNMLVQMQFNRKDKLDVYIKSFEDSLRFQDEMFKAFDPEPLLCHRYVANIYLASDNPADRWRETWEDLHPARYRLMFNRNDAFSVSIEKNLNFLLVVGFAVMEGMAGDKKKIYDEGQVFSFCMRLWEIIKDMTIKRDIHISHLSNKMICYIFYWLFVIGQKCNCEEKLGMFTDVLLRENWHPRLFLDVLTYFGKRGIAPWKYCSRDKRELFKKKVLWSSMYAIKMENCEYQLGKQGRALNKWFLDSSV